MNKLLFVLILLTLNSCIFSEEKGIEVTIINETSNSINNLEFTTTELLDIMRVDILQPNERATRFLSMQRNQNDGAYSLEFARWDGEKETNVFGYYTNGSAFDKNVECIVKNDTILVRFSGSVY